MLSGLQWVKESIFAAASSIMISCTKGSNPNTYTYKMGRNDVRNQGDVASYQKRTSFCQSVFPVVQYINQSLSILFSEAKIIARKAAPPRVLMKKNVIVSLSVCLVHKFKFFSALAFVYLLTLIWQSRQLLRQSIVGQMTIYLDSRKKLRFGLLRYYN